MNCRDFKPLLSAYADGELSQTQRDFVGEHLARCAQCQATLDDFRLVNRKLACLRETKSLADIKSSTMSKIKGEHAAKPIKTWLSKQPVWKISAVAILSLALVIGLVIVKPIIDNHSQAVMAANIVENSPEVKALFSGISFKTEVMKVADGKALVYVKGQEGIAATVDVDLNSKIVTIKSQPVGSYGQAAEKAGFTVGKPNYVPEGLVLEAVTTMGDSSQPFVAVNSLYSDHPITGLAPTKSITVRQRSLYNSSIGGESVAFLSAGFSQIEIQGETAWWKRGVIEQKSLDSSPYVNNDKIQLFWSSPSQQVGYVITGENLPIEELVKFANSIRLIN